MSRIRVRSITLSAFTGIALLLLLGYRKGILDSWLLFRYEMVIVPFLACAVYIVTITFKQFRCPQCNTLMEKRPVGGLWYSRDYCAACDKSYDILDYSPKELA